MQKEQIDSCVVLELVMKSQSGKEFRSLIEQCQRYFYYLAERECGSISLPALGEIFRVLYSIKDEAIRMQRFTFVCDLIRKCNISFNSPDHETYRIATTIKEFDTLIEPADALRVSEALTSGATLITLDRKLIDNQRLQEHFNIKIKGPA
ncbi:MAG TPA: hypothetical protein VJH88_03920 [Candidatus Nanoarchaeia archaeon]|nr:hypothetical protein [Candidatus Nanoarchaeia archaeon]